LTLFLGNCDADDTIRSTLMDFDRRRSGPLVFLETTAF
jgi:hypothetical protein